LQVTICSHNYLISHNQAFKFLIYSRLLFGIAVENRLCLITQFFPATYRFIIMYFLKLSGYIPETKQAEFEQTYRLSSTQIPKSCEEYSISKDVLNEGVYHFVSYWPLLNHMQAFKRSASFLIIIGAFKALGELYENSSGEIMTDRAGNEALINSRYLSLL